jgi:F0F1-type ATP synthase membrane subunit a
MKIVDVVKQRVQKFLLKQFKKKGYNFSDAPDHRQQGKITHSMGSIIWSCIFGLMANKKTLRDVEEMTQNLNEMASKLVSQQISDTTLDNEIRRMDHYSALWV